MKGDHFSVIYIYTAIRRKYDKTKVEKNFTHKHNYYFSRPQFCYTINVFAPCALYREILG